MDHEVIKKVMENGLTIVTVPVKQTHLVSVGFFIRCGSRNETASLNGISHFLEHLMFKGTKNYPMEVLHQQLDELSHMNNATTGQDRTNYFIHGSNTDVFKIIDLLTDIYLNPDFTEEDFNKEREVIIEELRMSSSTPEGYKNRLQRMYFLKLFQGTTVTLMPIGTEKNIRAMKPSDVWEYRNKFYQPNNTAIVVSGGINSDEIIDYIQNKLSSIKNTVPNTSRDHLNKDLIVVKNLIDQQKKPHINYLVDLNQNLATIKFVFLLADLFQNSEIEFNIISQIIGFGHNSRLIKAIRDKLELNRYVSSSNVNYNNINVYSVDCHVEPNNLHDVIKVIISELINIRDNGFTEKEIKQAKKIEETGLMMSLQEPTNLMDYYGDEVMQDSDRTIMDDFESIRSFTLEKANSMVKEIFQRRRFHLFIYGHILDENFEYIEEIL